MGSRADEKARVRRCRAVQVFPSRRQAGTRQCRPGARSSLATFKGTGMNLTDDHYKAVEQAVADIRAIEAKQGSTRESLQAIQDRLVQLASRTDLFNPAAFPPPRT